jgi:hypothetical protein
MRVAALVAAAVVTPARYQNRPLNATAMRPRLLHLPQEPTVIPTPQDSLRLQRGAEHLWRIRAEAQPACHEGDAKPPERPFQPIQGAPAGATAR